MRRILRKIAADQFNDLVMSLHHSYASRLEFVGFLNDGCFRLDVIDVKILKVLLQKF